MAEQFGPAWLYPRASGLSLVQRVWRRLRSGFSQCDKRVRRGVARVFYALPGLSKFNPRTRVRIVSEICRRTDEIDELVSPQCSQDTYATLRGCEIYHRELPSFIGGADESVFLKGASRYQEGASFRAPEVYLACFHDARIYSDDLLVLTGAGAIVYDSAMSGDGVLENNGILDRCMAPVGRKMAPGGYCLLGHPWSFGYYHWMLEVLPRLGVFDGVSALMGLPLIVPGEEKGFQQETLRLAGVAKDRLLPFNVKCLRIEKLYFTSIPAPSGNPSPHAIDWLRRTFLPLAQTESGKGAEAGSKGRRLYLSRSDAPRRRVMNEDEIIAFLVGSGFEVVCAGELSFERQVALFSEASCVVAPHGAAVTNMVFSPPGATLIELFGRNYINGCYWAMANILDQRYGCVTGPNIGLDYSISLDRLECIMRKAGY